MKRAIFVILLSSFALLVPVQAQTGTILGTIRDETAAVVPGVTVTIKNMNTGLEQMTISDGSGGYVIPLLSVGEYSISAELPGFRKEVITGISLQTGQSARIDLTLRVGEVTDELVVQGTAPLVKSDSMDLGIVVDNKKITELPLNRRNFMHLNSLDAGASTHSRVRTSFYARFGGNFSFQGSPSDSNNFLLDGADIRGQNDVRVGLRLSIEAIQEFKSETTLYSADKGRGAGGHISLVTKSGTNAFHGSAFEFIRNSALDARNFFDPPRETRKAQGLSEIPLFQQNQFGATLGGPVAKDKTFFFFSYEGYRSRKAITRLYSVPPVAFRNGDFSSISARIYDPLTTRPDPADPSKFVRNPFEGNVIPAHRINPVSKRALDLLFPLPNLPGVTANLRASPVLRSDENMYTARVDHIFFEHDRIFVRYSGVFDNTVTPTFTALPNFADQFNVPSQNAVVSYTRTLNPKAVNEFKVAYHRMTQFLQDRDLGKGILAQIGIKGTNPLWDYNPAISIAGFARTGGIGNAPNNRSENTYQLIDNFSYRLSKHTLGAGVDIRRIQLNGGIQSSPSGSFSFENFYTRLPADPRTGHAMADFLLGFPRSSRTSEGDGFRHHRTTHLGIYFKDDWNVNSKLTLNLGLRYEYFSPNVEIHNKIANFIVSLGRLVIADEAESVGLPRALFHADKNNFAPRIGLAFRPFGNNKTVIRAAYGIFYTPQLTIQTMVLGINPPALKAFLFLGDALVPVQTLENAFPKDKAVLSFTANSQNPNYRNGYNQHYSLNIQREVTKDMMVEIAYVGNKATKLRLTRDINLPRPGPGPLAPRRQFPNFAGIADIDHFGNSIYHGLKINVERRFSNGLSFLASYNWSKMLDTGGNLSFGESGDSLRRNPMDPSAERGRSIFDVRHRFVLSNIVELPFGPGRPLGSNLRGIGAALLGGWQFNSIVTLHSANPEDTFSVVDISNTGGGARPDLVGDPNTGPRTPAKWFNTDAFVLPAQYTFGTAGRNIIEGPGFVNFDLSLAKSVSIREGHSLQIRAEFFNALNHTNFDAPSGAFGSADFGRIFSAADSRQIQLGLKYIF